MSMKKEELFQELSVIFMIEFQRIRREIIKFLSPTWKYTIIKVMIYYMKLMDRNDVLIVYLEFKLLLMKMD